MRLVSRSTSITYELAQLISSDHNITYRHLIWHFCKSSGKRKLERIQERALRAICRSHSESYDELLERANRPALYNRRLQDIAVLMYKGLVPDNVSSLFIRKASTHLLRNSDVVIPRFNPGGGGTPRKIGWGCAARFPKPLPYL